MAFILSDAMIPSDHRTRFTCQPYHVLFNLNFNVTQYFFEIEASAKQKRKPFRVKLIFAWNNLYCMQIFLKVIPEAPYKKIVYIKNLAIKWKFLSEIYLPVILDIRIKAFSTEKSLPPCFCSSCMRVSNRLASTFPSCTPSWSNELIFQQNP